MHICICVCTYMCIYIYIYIYIRGVNSLCRVLVQLHIIMIRIWPGDGPPHYELLCPCFVKLLYLANMSIQNNKTYKEPQT